MITSLNKKKTQNRDSQVHHKVSLIPVKPWRTSMSVCDPTALNFNRENCASFD